jgi:hypothetical protein
VTEAIFGLIGVVIGGLLSGGVSYLADRRRSKAGTRIAARLMCSEIESNQVASRMSLGSRTWAQVKVGLKAEAWQGHQGPLASTLTDDEWGSVDTYYVLVLRLTQMAAGFANNDTLDYTQQSYLDTLVESGERASSIARRYGGGPDH